MLLLNADEDPISIQPSFSLLDGQDAATNFLGRVGRTPGAEPRKIRADASSSILESFSP